MQRALSIACLIITLPHSGIGAVAGSAELDIRPLGTVATPVSGLGVAVRDDWCFVAAGNGGLQVVSVRDPLRPERIANLSTPGPARAVVLSGDLAYVAMEAAGVGVVDVTSPDTPVWVTAVDTGGSATGVALDTDRLHVANGAAGVATLNLADPRLPVVLFQFDTPGFARSVAVAGPQVLVADGIAGLQALDLTSADAPRRLGTWDSPGTANAVVASGNTAYLADGEAGLQVLDVAAGADPLPLAELRVPGFAVGIAIAGTRVALANSSELVVADVSDPNLPGLAGRWLSPSTAQSAWLDGDLAYVANGLAGLQVLDLSTAANPPQVGVVPALSDLRQLALQDDLLVTAEGGGLGVHRLEPGPRVTRLGGTNQPAPAIDVALSDRTAYVAAGFQGLAVVDLTDPSSPAPVASRPGAGYASAVATDGRWTLLAEGEAGVAVFDVTDPASPRLHGRIASRDQSTSVAFDRGFGLVADGVAGLRIFEWSDDAPPVEIGVLDGLGPVRRIRVGDGILLLCTRFGLHLATASDPATPTVLGSWSGQGAPLDAAHSGRYVYVGEEGAGLTVLDILDPTHPVRVGGNSAFPLVALTRNGAGVLGGTSDGRLAVFGAHVPPIVLRMSRGVGGIPDLTLDGPEGAVLRVQRGPEPGIWDDWMQVTLPGEPVTIPDGSAAGTGSGFYRALTGGP